MNQTAIGSYNARKRKKQNLTQEQLAEQLSVSNKTISKWENGKCMPDCSIIQKLCEAIHVTLPELMDGEDAADSSARVYDDAQILDPLRRTQELERARSAAQAEYDARFAALEERSAAQAQRERQVDTADELTRLGLPAGFAPWLTGATAEESHARVTEFERTFRDAVRDSVTTRMAGAAPAEPVPTPAFDRESLRGMSPGEINAHWAEIQNTLKG